MSYDWPDYYNLKSRGPLYPLLDFGELAARLEAIAIFDRRGDIIALEDFSKGLGRIEPITWGAGGATTLVSDQWRSKGYSLKLVSGTGLTNSSTATLWTPLPQLGRVGFEYSFLYNAEPGTVDIEIRVRSNVFDIGPYATYVPATDELKIGVVDVGLVTIATGVRLDYMYKFWNTWKLVLDLETRKYVRLIVNSTTYDISGYAFTALDLAPTERIGGRASNYGPNEESHTMYIDDLILTQNEP